MPHNLPMAPVEAAFPLQTKIVENIENAIKYPYDELYLYASPAEIWDRATRFKSEVIIAPYLPPACCASVIRRVPSRLSAWERLIFGASVHDPREPGGPETAAEGSSQYSLYGARCS